MKKDQRASKFIRQFGGPGRDSGIVCFRFWQLVPAGGCPYRCSYCFLQTTPWFRFHPEYLHGMVYTNVDKMMRELDQWLADPIPKMLIVGELQDGLVFDRAFQKVTGKPLTHWLIPRFAEQRLHRLIFLTKSTEVELAAELEPTSQVVFSWSVNSRAIAKRWEVGAPPPAERFAAAATMRRAGWPVRFRLDPMVPYRNWRAGYGAAIRRINEIEPEMVTLGALRATSGKSLKSAAQRNRRDAGIFDFLTEERDASGFKYRIPYEQQVEMFRFAVSRLEKAVTPALCKEDEQLWRDVGIGFRGCHCLLGRNDGVVEEAPEVVRRLRLPTHRQPNLSGVRGCSPKNNRGGERVLASGGQF